MKHIEGFPPSATQIYKATAQILYFNRRLQLADSDLRKIDELIQSTISSYVYIYWYSSKKIIILLYDIQYRNSKFYSNIILDIYYQGFL